MNEFEFKIIDNETNRVLSSRIYAESLIEARMLINIIYRVGDATKLIGVPKMIGEV